MKRISIICLGLGLAACNQSVPSAGPGPSAGLAAPAAAAAPVVAQDDMQNLPPVYTPLVDMHRRSNVKFARDHAECRLQAAPQERAARDAMAQQQAGAAIAVAGAMASFLPVRGFNQAVNVGLASDAAQDIGGNIAAGGAAAGENATDDYALIVNNCLSRRGYRLLRA